MAPITNEGIERMEGMNCSEARRSLWPPERPRLAEAEVLRARRHVQDCASCESYLAQDRALLGAYDRVSLHGAPQALRERVFDALATERSKSLGFAPAGGASRRRFVAVAAASVAGLLAGGFAMSLRDVSETGLDEGGLFAEDYLRRAVSQERVVSSDAAEIGRFLTRELGRAIRPLDVPGLRCTSAEICLIKGRRGAMIQYVEEGQKISHYLIPQEGTKPRDPQPASTWSSSRGEGGNGGGPALVTWATSEVEQALVGEVPEARLIELAELGSH